MIQPRLAGWALPALLLLTGCGSEEGRSVGGVSPSEAQALNDAAAMLDERADNSVVTLPAPVTAGNAAVENAATPEPANTIRSQ